MTALSHIFGLFNIDKCMIYPMLTDIAGAAPTYGTGVSVPGIRDLNITPDILSKELYGDAQVLANKTRVRSIKATATHARLNLDALAIFLGGAVTDSGATPSRQSVFSDADATIVPGQFKLVAQILGVDGEILTGGDAHLTLWKATADTAALGGVMEDFSIPSLSFTGVRCMGTGTKRFTIELNETAVALA
jgi:hypothetical protein